MTHDSTFGPVSYLRQEYERQKALFAAQPTVVQHFIDLQAQHLATSLTSGAHQIHFSLPDRVVDKTPKTGEMAAMLVPAEVREQTIGSRFWRFQNNNLREEVRQRLQTLEQSPDQAINTSASLFRYAAAFYMIHAMLPSGRSVTYCAEGEEQVPTIPIQGNGETKSAITSATDAIAEQHPDENGRGELLVPFVPAARRFYLPQWVSFDEQGALLVGTIKEAESNQASMQRYIDILHTASSLAPYMVANDEYQHKRYGMLGQAINQGRALAKYETEQIIKNLLERVKKGTLNRGLRLSIPYYDDQELEMAERLLEVIPAGRIMFNPTFVVRATRQEQAKVSQDTRLNPSTRKYLLNELNLLEQTFTECRGAEGPLWVIK